MTVVIIDYGSGNLRSAAKAFERAAGTDGGEIRVSDKAEEVAKAERIVLPGVGAFADCKRGVEALPGLREALEEAVIGRGVPFLGICVGMQLMARVGFENGEHEGFGWIDAEVVALTPANGLKVPHMGWNDLVIAEPGHAVLAGLDSGTHAYFVHGFHLRPARPSEVIATVEYGEALCAVVGRDNMIGTQFHPEKSQQAGLRLIANFLSWRP
ncbi:MAG: imidazole glycerol phosphate synthase subunit HisH [Alphaproteobacteria bacterium]|jgi:glutamine amidotransferase|nr:imidazole glycerol phosphate synthase subunit HisH [Alphaproteobacteria bacterium]MDP6590920.1 imidazole glycerol phosphate synthase subunit HisH [Alphaproteobacteria bacterium]MDP6818132.1 imidazole glycerol phosphate synthase subunit HisH [Alphaproteobacteria bacterium]